MTLDELGVTEAEWTACLDLIGAWKPGQRCNDFLDKYADEPIWRCESGHSFPKPKKHRWRGEIHYPHDIPIPPVTDELLMRVLRKLGARDQADLEIYKVDEVMWGIEVGTFVENAESLEAAIIHAGAALRKE